MIVLIYVNFQKLTNFSNFCLDISPNFFFFFANIFLILIENLFFWNQDQLEFLKS